jgi:dipeptidyl aminopeptidase/acylaminoacyl peptidase
MAWARSAVGLLALSACAPETVPVQASLSEIAFVRDYDDGTEQLRGFSPGQVDLPLAPPEASGISLSQLSWSPDGSLLAFSRQGQDGNAQIHLLDPEFDETRYLTDGLSPAWSPARLELGFERPDPDDPMSRFMYVVDVQTGDERRIGEGQVFTFSWAPDGERLVVSGLWPELDTNEALFILDVGTGDVTRIDPDPPNLSNPPRDWAAQWSGDGTTIAFLSERDLGFDTFSAIYRMDPDGSNFGKLSGDDYYGIGGLFLAPVGDGLAFSWWVFDAIYPGDSGFDIRSEHGGLWLSEPRQMAWSPDAKFVALVESQGISVQELGETYAYEDVETETRTWSDRSPAWRRVPGE